MSKTIREIIDFKCDTCGKDARRSLSSRSSVSLKLPRRKNNIHICGYCLLEGERQFKEEQGICSRCDGRGSITETKTDDSYSPWKETNVCPKCGGTGIT